MKLFYLEEEIRLTCCRKIVRMPKILSGFTIKSKFIYQQNDAPLFLQKNTIHDGRVFYVFISVFQLFNPTPPPTHFLFTKVYSMYVKYLLLCTKHRGKQETFMLIFVYVLCVALCTCNESVSLASNSSNIECVKDVNLLED